MSRKNLCRMMETALTGLALLVFLSACGGGGDSGGVAGSSGTITLATTASSIPADGSSSVAITATIRDSAGNPVRHYTKVTFSTTLGRFRNGANTYTMETQPPLNDKGWPDWDAPPTGVAEAALIAGTTPGTAKVTVTSNNVTQTLYITMGGDVVSIQLDVSPASIPADGLTSATITATLTDGVGSPVTPGTSVTFTTNRGTFPNAGQTYTVTTPDATGVVSVSLRSGTASGSARVTATANGVTQAAYVGFGGQAVFITLEASPAQIPADGVSASSITATLVDANGSPVMAGTSVTFSTTLGTFLNGSRTYRVETGDSTGRVMVSLISATEAGAARVTAESNGVRQSVYVGFGGAPVGITVTANPDSIWADGQSSSAIQATLTDASGAPVTPGTSVTFTTDLGTFSNGEKTYTVTTPDDTGIVTVSLRSATTTGVAQVTVTSNGVSQSVYVNFVQQGGGAFSMTLTADPTSIPADGTSSSRITATLTNISGNPVPPGTEVTFSTTLGKFSNGSNVYTVKTPDVSGVVSISLISGTTGGAALVTATANGVTQSITVTFRGGAVTLALTANPTRIPADGFSSATITATMTDAVGEPVIAGTSITFTTTLGKFSNNAQSITATTSDDTGIVSVSLISGTTPGTATVTAQSGGVSQAVSVKFTGPPATITVSATPQTLVADGETTSAVKATVLDANGNAVEDGEALTVSAQYGSVSNINPVTASGVATITYTSPSSVPQGGTDTVSFTASNGVSGNATITLTGPQVATVTLSADPAAIPANGTSTSTISATVTVQGGSPAPEGTSVTFTILSAAGGSFGGQSSTTKTTDANGVARATLTAGTSPGTETIRAEASGVISDVITVTYQPGSITLTIVPNYLLATGADRAVVTAALKDVSGAPAPDGTTVNFSLSDLTLGSLSASSATTSGGTGEASVTFTSGTKGGTVTVTATWATGGNTVTGTADITIQEPPASIDLASGYPNPTSISIKGTGGQSSSELRFDVKDTRGNLVASGYKIDFYIETGPNGGEELIPSSATTSDGQVTTFLHSGVRSGPVSIKAVYHNDTTISKTVSQIVIVSGPPVGEAFGIAAQYVNISGFWMAGLANPVTANLADIYGNAVPDGTAVSFKTYNTGGYFATGSGSTTNGRATDNLMSGGTYLRPLNGFLSITAEAVGGKSTHVTALEIAPGTNIVYAGTNGGGVYKSIDSGATWENISRSSENPKQGQNWIESYVKGQSAISVDPEHPDVVYVGTGYLGRGNLYRSKDGGANWNSNDIEEWAGLYSGNSAVLTVLCDDGSDYVWIGTEGEGAFYAADGETFTAATTGLTYGTSVREIVKAGGSGAGATLYAATHTGVYRSTGGVNWSQPGTFSESNVNTLAIHPTINTVLYAGTDNAGVWVSTNSGVNWAQYYPNGMGKGLSASVPVADVNNTGNGSMSTVGVATTTPSEFWAVTCTAVAPGSGTFKVEGSVSGLQANTATVGVPYTSASGGISFTISAGTVDFAVGDSFTFTTIRDPGKTIKDLMVDAQNDRIYAITYYMSPIEPYHAVGNVYVHPLNPDGSMAAGDWVEANTGLPQFEPPNDTTLFAQYVMATDDETTPSFFLIGGDGINLYKATEGLTTGSPQWRVSKTGLTNLLMARMPILFSGVCTMKITETQTGATTYAYTIYIQDVNNNPPISGSVFTAITYDATNAEVARLKEVQYPDGYTFAGTFSNPADPATDNPYTVNVDFSGLVDHVTFTFIPASSSTVPGSSGSKQEVTYSH